MTYQVLARKWRPQDFSSLVGQGPIVTALRNAITEGRIAQAYLFSGIRGVGKTTTARLLAKAVNCENGPAADPCNDCQACRDITAGSDLDVIEVDAATYSKVEQVRELTESLRYGPARHRYKVVVIDEIHRLSRQAFDALLKIVEEPPPHLIFIFATTEAEAVPATVLSRCQEFRFRRVASSELSAHLRKLADAEEIEASDAALRLIARAGEGSVRDSVALLDQLATFGSGTIRDEDAARLAGNLDAALFSDLLRAILAGESATVSATARRVEVEGWDPRHVFAQFLSYGRDALHLAMGGSVDQLDLPGEDAAALAQIAASTRYENLLRLLQLLLSSEEIVRRSEAGALAVEIAWLRAAELPKLTQIEELLQGRAQQGPAATAAAAPRSAPPPRPKSSPVAADKRPPRSARPRPAPVKEPAGSPLESSEERATQPPEPSSPPPATANSEAATSDPDKAATRAAGTPTKAALLEEVSRYKQPLAAHLDAAQDLVFEEGRLLIYSAPGDSWLAKALERKSNRTVLEQALAHLCGASTTWQLLEGKAEEPDTQVDPDTALQTGDPAVQNPTVQAVLDIFGGEAHAVTPTESNQEK